MQLFTNVFGVTVGRLLNVCRTGRTSALSVNASRCQFNMHTGDIVTSCGAARISDDASLRFRKPVFPVPVVPMTIDDSNPTDGARELLKKIRPEWPSDRLRFTVLYDLYLEPDLVTVHHTA